jgi:hypothetical protein
MTEEFRDLNIVGINPDRCVRATRCDMSVRLQRHERRLEQRPGIIIKTDAEEVAERITGIPKRRRWETALGNAVVLIGKITGTEPPDVVDSQITTLFDGLRDPDRRVQTMQRVEVLFKEYVPPTKR